MVFISTILLTAGALLINRASKAANSIDSEKHLESQKRFDAARDRVGSDFSPFFLNLEKFVNRYPAPSFTYYVGVDIGATNTRVVIVTKLENSGQIERFEMEKFKCSSVSQLLDVLQFVSSEVMNVFAGQRASAAALALAGPIDKDRVVLTNYVESSQVLNKQDLPSELFPFAKTRFLNDLEACCYGIIAAGENGELNNYFTNAFEPFNNERAADSLHLEQKSYAVLAMGTGLGCGLILCHKNKDGTLSFSPLALEAGHALIGMEGTAREDHKKSVQRFEYISEQVWNSKHGIEYEDICSGRGLKYCYNFERAYDNQPTNDEMDAGDIAPQYKENRYARMALEVHYGYLMKAAQNICVMIPSCKGVFFAGDNQVNNEQFVSENLDMLRDKFFDHQKKHWLEDVAAYRQVKQNNFNLVGCEYCAMLL